MGCDLPACGVLTVKAVPLIDALSALRLVLAAPGIPHALWMKVMHAEVGLNQALKEAELEVPVEAEEQT